MASFPQSQSLVLLESIIDAFEVTELQSSSTTPPMPPPMPHPLKISSLWFIGRNYDNECNVPAEESDEYSRRELTVCDWSLKKQIIAVTIGKGYNIYTVKSKKEVLCFGFLRESQRIFPFKKNPFYIIPDPVFTLCLLYLEHLKQYWAAGNNQHGQCGVGTVDSQIPVSRVEGLSDTLKVKSGSFGASTLWIKYDGSLYVNGSNRYGQMGIRCIDNIRVPTLSPFTQQHPELRCIDGGSSRNFNVLIADNGSIWFAGEIGFYGAFDSESKFIPLDAPHEVHVVSVAVGVAHMLFLTQNGSVLSFGRNGYGELGLSQDLKNEYSRLQLISFFDENNIEIQSLCCGDNHNLALSTDGKVYGWGDNEEGQCGVSDGANRENVCTPESIYMRVDIAVKSIECGSNHSGLITMDNEVYLWGWNGSNECCANVDGQEIECVFTPQNVSDYVLSKSKKDRIMMLYLGNSTSMFLLE